MWAHDAVRCQTEKNTLWEGWQEEAHCRLMLIDVAREGEREKTDDSDTSCHGTIAKSSLTFRISPIPSPPPPPLLKKSPTQFRTLTERPFDAILTLNSTEGNRNYAAWLHCCDAFLPLWITSSTYAPFQRTICMQSNDFNICNSIMSSLLKERIHSSQNSIDALSSLISRSIRYDFFQVKNLAGSSEAILLITPRKQREVLPWRGSAVWLIVKWCASTEKVFVKLSRLITDSFDCTRAHNNWRKPMRAEEMERLNEIDWFFRRREKQNNAVYLHTQRGDEGESIHMFDRFGRSWMNSCQYRW